MSNEDMVVKRLTKQTTKNAGWNVLTRLFSKVAGLFFTIILARLLLPELFGAYNLVMSLVVICIMFTDLGIGNAAIRYVSEFIGKKDNQKIRSYFRYFLKIKIILAFIVIFILLLISKFLAYNIFDKPIIFIPILASTVFILVASISDLFKITFIAKRDLSKIFILETFFGVSKVIFAILAIYILSEEYVIAGIFIALALAAFMTSLLNFFLLRKEKELLIGPIEQIEKKRVWIYLKSMSLVSISLIFFGSIDTLMLGKFVDLAFIGYYRVALSFVLASSSLFGFTYVLLPIFTQIDGKRFDRGFKKVARYLAIFVIPASVGIAIVGKYLIILFYGKEYLLATSSLYVLAPIILISPFVVLYSSIFQAREKTDVLVKAVIISLGINILLNYILIKSLLGLGYGYAIVGAGIATVISRIFYLVFLSRKSNKLFKTKIPWRTILKSIFVTIVMAGFLLWFNLFVESNIYLVILEVIFGILIYFVGMILIGEVDKEDFEVVSGLIKK